MDSSDSELGAPGAPPTPPQRNCWLPPCMRDAAAAAVVLENQVAEVDLSDGGDLAEADQSHEATEGRGSQAEGEAPSDTTVSIVESSTVDQQPPVRMQLDLIFGAILWLF
jgi:hypothetical protein